MCTESMKEVPLWLHQAFTADYMDREFRELCSSCDRSQATEPCGM